MLFMLLFAPVVIITVAGYSLGGLYGGTSTFRLPVVNYDKGEVADGIIEALRQQSSVSLDLLDDSAAARKLVSHRDRTPLALEIPAGTTAAVDGGARSTTASCMSIRCSRIEVNALELHIAELCRKVGLQARARAQAADRAKRMPTCAQVCTVFRLRSQSEQTQLRSEAAKSRCRCGSIGARADRRRDEARRGRGRRDYQDARRSRHRRDFARNSPRAR